ncbi:MAG TPA: Calx-beta domain-containing protein, partial [Vicinamibacteria bacterium]
LAAGAPGGFFSRGGTLYLKLADGSAPAAHVIHAARREEGFVLDGRSHVRLENLEIRHYGSGDFGKGVYLRLSSDCAVRGSRIHHIGSAGIWMRGGERNLIEGNEVWDTSIFGWPWSLVKGSPAETTAIYQTDAPGRGNVIRGNTTRGFFNGIAPCGSGAPAGGVLTNEIDVYDNALSQHLDDAFEPEGHCSNLRLWGNRIQDVHMAFAVAPAGVGPIYVVRNVVYRHGNTRASQVDGATSSALKINHDTGTPLGPLFLYHNTVLTDAPATDAVALLNERGGAAGIRARNNVLAGTRYALSKSHPVALDWDGDDLFSTSPTRLVRWLSASYATVAALRTATGQERGGVQAAPQLEDPDGGDFRPAPGSALIDRGLVVPGINDGFRGPAPDIGAVEREDGPPLPTLSVSDATVVEGQVGTTSAVFAVTLSAASTQTVTVRFATAPNTAAEGVDYLRAAGTLSFPPGTLRRTVAVTVVGDLLREADEEFWLNLDGPSGAELGDGQGRGRIRNDDAPPAISISDVSVAEGASGTRSAVFTVTLSAASGQTVSMAFTTAGRTAVAGSDFTTTAGTLVFAPGTTTRTVAVPVLGDTRPEPDETFVVNLSVPANATLADGQGVGTIRNDDPVP